MMKRTFDGSRWGVVWAVVVVGCLGVTGEAGAELGAALSEPLSLPVTREAVPFAALKGKKVLVVGAWSLCGDGKTTDEARELLDRLLGEAGARIYVGGTGADVALVGTFVEPVKPGNVANSALMANWKKAVERQKQQESAAESTKEKWDEQRTIQESGWSVERFKREMVLLRKLPDLRFDNIAFGDAAEFIHDIANLRLDIDWAALGKVGVDKKTPVSLHFRNVETRDALLLMLWELNPRLAVSQGAEAIHVGTAESLKEGGAGANDSRPIPRRWSVMSPLMMQRPLPQVKFDQVALKDALDFLRDISGANFWVDWKALGSVGVMPGSKVTLNETNMKFSVILQHLLAALPGNKVALKAVGVRDNLILISTESSLKAMGVTGMAGLKK